MKKIILLLTITVVLSLSSIEVSADNPSCLINPTVSESAVSIRIECSDGGTYLLGVNAPDGESFIYDTFPYSVGFPYDRNFTASSAGTHRIMVFKTGSADVVAESSFDIESEPPTALSCGDAAQENDSRCPASDCPATECSGGSWYCLESTTECFESFVPTDKEVLWKLCDQVVDGERKLQCINCSGVWTAVGCIPTDPTNMVQALVTIGLFIGGGVTLLIILAGSFVLSTSQGDPKKTSDAKEMITSAIIGLIFIIFSVSILQLIGVQILQIPGFGQ